MTRTGIGLVFLCLVVFNSGCSGLVCGEGTYERNGMCVPIEDDGSISDADSSDADVNDSDTLDGDDREDSDDDQDIPIPEVVDWTNTRSEPLETVEVGTVNGALLGLPPAGFITVTEGCAGFNETQLCDFTWLDDSLSQVARVRNAWPIRTDRFSTYDTTTLGLLVGINERCLDEFNAPIESGTLSLFDSASGSVSWSRSGIFFNRWAGSVFSDMDGWVQANFDTENPCNEEGKAVMLENDTFFHPVDGSGSWLNSDQLGRRNQELPDGRFFSILLVKETAGGERFALVDPSDPNSPTILHDDFMNNLFVDGYGEGFLYAQFEDESRTPNILVHELESGETSVVSAESLANPSVSLLSDYSGRWLMLCEILSPSSAVQNCLIHDSRGEVPDREFQLVAQMRSAALRSASNSFYYVGLNETQSDLVLNHVNLSNGEQTELPDLGTVYKTSDARTVISITGRGVLLYQGTEAHLVEERIPSEIAFTHNRWGINPEYHHGSHLIRMVTSLGYVRNGYSVFNEHSGRTYRLTDQVYIDDMTGRDNCGIPGFANTMDNVGTGRYLFFSELDESTDEIDLFLVPADFSTPPMFLMSAPPDYCIRPMVTAAGDRAAIVLRDSESGHLRLFQASLP